MSEALLTENQRSNWESCPAFGFFTHCSNDDELLVDAVSQALALVVLVGRANEMESNGNGSSARV